MKGERFLFPAGRSVPLMGIMMGLVLSLGNVAAIAAPGQVPDNRAETEPNAEPAKRESLAVHGLVIDATTKRAIARFRVIPGALMSAGSDSGSPISSRRTGAGDSTSRRANGSGIKHSSGSRPRAIGRASRGS